MKIRLRRVLHTVLATAALALASTSHAAAFRWEVDIDFVYGGGQGTGVFYSDGQNITGWDITTFRDWSKPIYEEVVFGYHYTSETSTLDLSNGSFRLLRNGAPQDGYMGNYLELLSLTSIANGVWSTDTALEHTLSEGGSSLSQSGWASYTMTPFAGAGAGSVTPPVPEPETIGMLLLGLGLVGVAARRKQRAA